MVMNNIDLSELSNKILQKVMREVTEAYHNGNIGNLRNTFNLKKGLTNPFLYGIL